jgi:hypothetical protein
MSDAHYDAPDDVDVILSMERFEESDEYTTAIKEWLLTSGLADDWARDTFPGTMRYDTEYAKWCDGQAPS